MIRPWTVVQKSQGKQNSVYIFCVPCIKVIRSIIIFIALFGPEVQEIMGQKSFAK